jgi:hypothetical protein
MLPSEKAERWVRRIGYVGLILLFVYILRWFVGFVGGTAQKALEQREEHLPESRAPIVETA